MQLMELDIPMVLALNMMDEVEGNGGSFRINEMERISLSSSRRLLYSAKYRARAGIPNVVYGVRSKLLIIRLLVSIFKF